MLFFLNIPKKGCISGIAIPSLATHMGRLGALNDPFPDSGAVAVRIGGAWSVSDSCCIQEFCPLETHNLRLKESQLNSDENDLSRVVRMCGTSFMRRDV